MAPSSTEPGPRELVEVAPGVLVATARTYTTTSTLLVAEDGTGVLVDPAVSPADLLTLAAAVRRRVRLVGAFATHPHWDHVLWHRDLGDVPRWSTPRAAATADRERTALVEGARTTPGHDEDLVARLTPWAGASLPWSREVVVVEHGAHAPGSAALLLPDAGVLVAGDVLSDVEVPLLDPDQDDPVGAYLAGLDTLEAAVREHDVTVLVPGHGGVGSGAEVERRFAADRAYLGALARGTEPDDARLDDPWLRSEHERQVAALTRR